MILGLIGLITAIVTISFLIGNNLTNLTGFVVAEDNVGNVVENITEIPGFRLYTKAICKNVSNFVICHDELFASCGGFEYMLPENEVDGNGVFGKDWEDPRNS